MATVFVDADACPVRAEAERVAARRGAALVLVTNGGIRQPAYAGARVVYVPAEPDAADRWIAGQAGPGDVVVTADVPLAAAVVARGARVLAPDGHAFTPANIGERLAARDLAAELRAADPFRRGGGRPFGPADRSRFLAALDRALGAAPPGPHAAPVQP